MESWSRVLLVLQRICTFVRSVFICCSDTKAKLFLCRSKKDDGNADSSIQDKKNQRLFRSTGIVLLISCALLICFANCPRIAGTHLLLMSFFSVSIAVGKNVDLDGGAYEQ